MEISTIIIRFLVVFVSSFLFGLNRQRHHKPVGFGTFIFVAVGSSALTIAVSTFYESPLPILGAIVTGIGFLGAGALIKTTDKTFGLTTAASVWSFAIFGSVIGIGQYFIGLVLYGLIWIVIFFDKQLENEGIGSYRKKLIININGVDNAKEAEELISNGIGNYRLISSDIDKKNDACSMHYLIEGTKQELNSKVNSIYKKKWCNSIKFE